jgi:anti-anti-sigma regulatory factor
MPDDDFELGCSADAGDETPTEVLLPGTGQRTMTAAAAIGEFPSVIISRNGRHASIEFRGIEVLDDHDCLAAHRPQLMQLLDDPGCELVTFDLTGVKIVLSGMLGFLATATKRCREVEIRNPSPEVLEILRITRLDTLLMIRGATA